MKRIKNAPETITFWVPVWQYDKSDNRLFGTPIVGEEMPVLNNPTQNFIGYKGPFTMELD